MTLPAPLDAMVPDWPAPGGVRALCSTRVGGVSRPPYDSLNLGNHVADDPSAVAANRKRFADVLGARPVFLQQVHGRQVVVLDEHSRHGMQADGCVTTTRGVACTMMVADCLPVLFASADGTAVGAAHAGWRGLAAGVLEAVVDAVRERSATPGVIAWLGPCIGPDAFEVGDDVRTSFVQGDAAAATHFRPHASGKWLADLPALARRRLRALGVAAVHGNDGTPAWCTVTNPARFFSHRRDRVSGRFAAAVWLGA